MIFRALLPSVTKSHTEKRILKTNALHLFRIINDVDQYSTFLPLCTQSKVLSRSNNTFRAVLTVGFPPLFEETYTSHVVTNQDQLEISAKSVESNLFDALSSQWRLRPHGHNQCHVDFQVTLSVSNPVIVGTLDRVLAEVAGRQVAAFEKRCSIVPVPNDIASSMDA